MATRPFIVSPEDYSDALDIVGEHVTVLASAPDKRMQLTGGRWAP
jgi:hypothetical protein